MPSLTFVRYSRVGKRSIPFLKGNVTCSIVSIPNPSPPTFKITQLKHNVIVKGPLGQLSFPLFHGLTLSIERGLLENEEEIHIKRDDKIYNQELEKHQRKFIDGMWGTTNTLLRQMISGVQELFQISIRLVGIGYKATIPEAGILSLKVGFSHEIRIPISSDIQISLPNPNKILLKGIDLQKITQLAAKIRSYRKPEPYGGKGIFVGSETIKLKQGKERV